MATIRFKAQVACGGIRDLRFETEGRNICVVRYVIKLEPTDPDLQEDPRRQLVVDAELSVMEKDALDKENVDIVGFVFHKYVFPELRCMRNPQEIQTRNLGMVSLHPPTVKGEALRPLPEGRILLSLPNGKD